MAPEYEISSSTQNIGTEKASTTQQKKTKIKTAPKPLYPIFYLEKVF